MRRVYANTEPVAPTVEDYANCANNEERLRLRDKYVDDMMTYKAQQNGGYYEDAANYTVKEARFRNQENKKIEEAMYLVRSKYGICDIIDSYLGNHVRILNASGCNVFCSVDNLGRPIIEVDTNLDGIRVRVYTHDIERDNGDEGWTFTVSVVNASKGFTVGTDDPVATYTRYAAIARLAQVIYEMEIFPADYAD